MLQLLQCYTQNIEHFPCQQNLPTPTCHQTNALLPGVTAMRLSWLFVVHICRTRNASFSGHSI